MSIWDANIANNFSKMELEPQWRDALSQQSSELLVAKANEVDALGNTEVGGDSTSQGEVRVSPSRIVISYDSTAGLWFLSAQRVVA